MDKQKSNHWIDYLPKATDIYNQLQHNATGQKPVVLWTGKRTSLLELSNDSKY